MINTSDITKKNTSINQTVNNIFLHKKDPRIDLVSIVSLLHEIKESIFIAKNLKNLDISLH